MQAERTPLRIISADPGLLVRKARKAWNCDGDGSASHRHADDCPGTIAPGSAYIECLWEASAYESGSRSSLACAALFLADHLTFEAGDDRGCGPHIRPLYPWKAPDA